MRYERVFLIQPNYPQSHYSNPCWPLGLGYVAEALKHANIQCAVIDMGFGYKQSFLFNGISKFKPQIIGISIMSSKYRYHYALAEAIKRAFPGIPIVAGGPHVATFREKVLIECPSIDYAIVGEGEESMVELCKGEDLAQIKGIFYRGDSGVLYTGDRKRILDLDALYFPVFDGFEAEKYDTVSISIYSSRGCPHRCIYCPIRNTVGNQWICRSPKNVADEIEFDERQL